MGNSSKEKLPRGQINININISICECFVRFFVFEEKKRRKGIERNREGRNIHPLGKNF